MLPPSEEHLFYLALLTLGVLILVLLYDVYCFYNNKTTIIHFGEMGKKCIKNAQVYKTIYMIIVCKSGLSPHDSDVR